MKMNVTDVKFTEILSKNNIGSTYKAEIDGTYYVVKCINISTVSDSEIERITHSFDAQIRLASNIEDANQKRSIALFSESFRQDGQLCYIRPYLEGMALSQKISECREITPSEAAELILKISHTVAFCHQHGIIHGDLKPENIIIADDDEISIIDWETMKLNKEAQNIYANGRTLSTSELVGTPHYMAPEQLGGNTSEKSDVYALGMLFYKVLTGETPFDRCNIAEIYEEKYKDIDDIVFHDKKINADITAIISNAIKVDPNSRTPSVEQFVNEVEDYLSISSHMVNVQEQLLNDYITCIHENSSDEKCQLVLIGHPGAGKTVLAAGLFAMNNKRFSVEGTNSETITFANNVKTILQKGEWPAPTAKSRPQKLEFKMFYNKHQDSISFDEYAGENVLYPNYFKDFFNPAPVGAIILLNPSFIVAKDQLSQNKQITSLKNSIAYLSGLSNPPPIAFVITAADRLKTDLKDRVSEFEKYVCEIENSLKAHKANYKTFYVSVSGELEAYDKNTKAALNPEKVQDPFIWILKQIHKSKKLSSLKKISNWGIAILIFLGVLLLTRWCWEWKGNNELQKRITAYDKIYSGKNKTDDLDSYIKRLAVLRSELCVRGHILTEKNAGSQTAECDYKCTLWYKHHVFPDRKESLRTTIGNLEKKIDQTKFLLLKTKYEQLVKDVGKADFNNELSYLKDDFKIWVPLIEDVIHGRRDFETKYIAELPALEERHKFTVVIKNLQKVISEKKSEYPVGLDSEISQLPAEAHTQLSSEEWKKLNTKVNECRKEAHKSVERIKFDAIETRLTAIINNNNCRKFPPEIDTAIAHLPSPSHLSDKERKEFDKRVADLQEQARKCVAIRISEDVKQLLRSAINNPGNGIPDEYQNKYKEWSDCADNFIDKSEFNTINGEIAALLEQAYEKIFCYLSNNFQKDIDSFNGNSEELADLIRRYNNFATTNYNVKTELHTHEMSAIFSKMRKRLEKYITDLCVQFDKKQMAKKQECTPEFKDDIVKNILPLIPEIKEELQSLLDTKIAETNKKWKKERENVIDTFLKGHASKSASDCLAGIKVLVVEEQETGNPYLEKAEQFVVNKMTEDAQSFLSKVHARTFAENDFLEMKRIAFTNRNLFKRCPILKDAPISAWLNKYYEWKHKNTRFNVAVGDLSVSVSYSDPDKPYFNDFYCKAADKILARYHSNGWNTTRFKNDTFVSFLEKKYWPPAAEDMKIGQKWEFYGKIKDCRGAGDRFIAEVYCSFYPGVDEISSIIQARGDNGVTVKIDINITGEPFLKWLKNNPFPGAR